MNHRFPRTELIFSFIRTVAAIAVVTFMLTAPKPLAIIIPGPYPEYTMPLNMTFMQEQIPDYGEEERESEWPKEFEVQVTGGEYSRLDTRNLYEEVRDRYYIVTRNCGQDALMDFAVIRIYQSGYMEIEWEMFNTVCTVVDTTYTRPHPDDIPFP